jgi:Cation transporter/ATPase, N-terminus
MEQSYTKTTAQVLKHFGVKENKGLSSQQIPEYRATYGSNGEQTSNRAAQCIN